MTEREQIVAETEARIVAWLRAQAVYPANIRLLTSLADAIEAGEHLGGAHMEKPDGE